MDEDFAFAIDTPGLGPILTPVVQLSGWFVSKRADPQTIEIKINGKKIYWDKLKRADVRSESGAAANGFTALVDLATCQVGGSVALTIEFVSGGSVLGVAFRRLAAPDIRKKAPLYFFIHMPKAGGTAIRRQIERHVGAINIVAPYSDNQAEVAKSLSTFSERGWSDVDIVYAHFAYGLHNSVRSRKRRYLSIVRDPYERTLSQFFYQKYYEEREGIDAECSIFDYLNGRNFSDNTMVRYFSGRIGDQDSAAASWLDEAINNIERDFEFIGLQEALPDTLMRLSKILGVDLVSGVSRVNETPPTKERMYLDVEKFRRAAFDKISMDIELYDYVLEKFWGTQRRKDAAESLPQPSRAELLAAK